MMRAPKLAAMSDVPSALDESTTRTSANRDSSGKLIRRLGPSFRTGTTTVTGSLSVTISPPYFPSRIAYNDAFGRYVAHNHCAGSYHRAFADHHAGPNERLSADPRARSDGDRLL